MNRTTPIVVAMLGLLCAANSPGGTITQFTRAKINLYDKSLVFVEKVDPWKVPINVEDSSKPGYLGVRRGGALVYLRVSEVVAKGLPQGACLQTSNGSNGSTTRNLASQGIGSGLGHSGAPCIPK